MSSENPSFYREIPSLVRDITSGSRSLSQRSKDRLFSRIRETASYDPVVLAVAEIQQLLLHTPQRRVVLGSLSLLDDVIFAGGEPRETNEQIVLNVDQPVVIQAVDRIIANHPRLLGSTGFKEYLPPNYFSLVEKTAPFARRNFEDGVDKVIMLQRSAVANPDKVEDDSRAYLAWRREVVMMMNSDEIYATPPARDRYVDLLKDVPASGVGVMGKEKVFDDKFNGVSLRDIEALLVPLSWDDFQKITTYLSEAFSRTDLNEISLADYQHHLSLIFPIPTVLHGQFEALDLNNKKLFSVVNSWVEAMWSNLLIDHDEARLEPIKKLFLASTHSFKAALITAGLPSTIIRPHIHDARYNGQNYKEFVFSKPLMLLSLANANAQEEIGSTGAFPQTDDILSMFLTDEVIPMVEDILEKWGLLDEFRETVNLLAQHHSIEDMKNLRAREIKESFIHLVGEEFMEKLRTNSAELVQQTQDAWDSIFDGDGMHYIPSLGVINRVSFSKDSTAEMMGLGSVDLRRFGDLQNWKVAVRFTLKKGGSVITGILDNNGKFETEKVIEESVPGLSLLLNDVAVLVFKDLVLQKEAEEKSRKDGSGKDKKQKGENLGTFPLSEQHGMLPRIQSDKELIDVVSKYKTNKPPRRVDIHKASLRGRKEYLAAIASYQQVVTSGSDEAIREKIIQLEAARGASYKASQDKVKSVPIRFKLEEVTDPVTHEVRHLQTWVIEHSNPKPNDEELKSLSKIYMKYYRGASSLSFLAQLQPWFVGK